METVCDFCSFVFHNLFSAFTDKEKLVEYGLPMLIIIPVVVVIGVFSEYDQIKSEWTEWRSKRKKAADARNKEVGGIQTPPSNATMEPTVLIKASVKQAENNSMSDLWSPDSLRGMYWRSQQGIRNKDIAVSVSNDLGFFKRMTMKLEAKTGIIKEHNNMVREFRKILKNPICPHCLKTIITSEVSFCCPFCDQNHFEEGTKVHIEGATIPESVGAAIATRMAEGMLMSALFNACPACRSKIQYLTCYNCQKEIDLFAPYNYQELERRRYGR